MPSKTSDHILRVGGVGTGRIFQFAHLRAYPPFLGKAWLTGFYDLNPARAQEARDKYAAMLEEHAAKHPEQGEAARANIAALRCYDSLDALLDNVDVIDVATHARGKMPAAIAAANKGVHVMVEKPMARTWTEADRAARAFANRPGVFFQLNDDNVFDPKYHLLHDLIARDAIGAVQHVTLIRGSRLDATSVLKAQANALENGGGCLMDYGSHGMAGTWYAIGTRFKPVKVEAIQIAVLHRHRVLEGDPYIMEVDDNAQIKVLMEDPATGTWATIFFEATWCGGHIGPDKEKPGGQAGGYLRIWGDKGLIESNAATLTTVRSWDGGETGLPLKEYPHESVSFSEEIGTFLDGIRAGRPSPIDVNFGAEITAICGAAYLSALRGKAVTLDEFKEFSRGYIRKYGDNAQADDAIVLDLLEPYRMKETRMKVSLYTISLSGGYYRGPAVPLLDIFPRAKGWGYDGIEIEAKRPHGSPLDLDAKARAHPGEAAAKHGLEISCIASYNDFSSPIEEHRENELLMVREQIKMAADLGAPFVRVFAAWSGVTRRDGVITYDIARYNIDHRYPGTTALERWVYVRECLREAAKMAEDAGVVLALQNHKPVTNDNYRDMLDFIHEVNSPALKACLDAPLFDRHSEAAYREALTATGSLMVHTHYGGRFERLPDGTIVTLDRKPNGEVTDYPTFMRLAKEIAGFQGHTGYELCSPVLIGHTHQGLDYALLQMELAAEFMGRIVDSL